MFLTLSEDICRNIPMNFSIVDGLLFSLKLIFTLGIVYPQIIINRLYISYCSIQLMKVLYFRNTI